MIDRLAFRNFVLKPWRSAFLLVGFALGVGVMIVLLSIGEALLAQARDEKLVGGGSITVLPEGIDVEVMKTGGLGGLFFSIDHARFVYRQLLASPRLERYVSAAAPQIEGKLLYARTTDGREIPVMASGEIPSRTTAVGAMPVIGSGAWTDDGFDRRWADPSLDELRHDIDHFHVPPIEARGDTTWAEWHYFNVLSPDRKRWAFISYIIGQRGGEVLVTLNEEGKPPRRFMSLAYPKVVRFSTHDANVAIGGSTVTVLADGRYALRARAVEEKSGAPLDLSLVVAPAPGAYFPGAELSGGENVSGYVVPGLRADATGSICVSGRCEQFDRAQSYHDHNWGVWRGVTWDWGAARAGQYTLLYGRVFPADSAITSQPLFVYVTDSLGFLALFRPRDITYDDVTGIPSRATMVDVRGDDTLRVDLTIEDAMSTDTRSAGRGLGKSRFIQMKGLMRISGRVAGRPLSGTGSGFFETYR